MKKKLLFCVFAFVALVTLVGCGSKGDSNSIVGTWEYESNSQYVYTFNADKTGSYNAYGTEMKFTYEDNGKEVSILYTGNTDASTYKYRIEKNKLIINDSVGSEVTYIKK